LEVGARVDGVDGVDGVAGVDGADGAVDVVGSADGSDVGPLLGAGVTEVGPTDGTVVG
jgi:hypothetical protein